MTFKVPLSRKRKGQEKINFLTGNFRWVLIFLILRPEYRVAKIKTVIIYSNKNSKVGSFEITKLKNRENYFTHFYL